MADTDDDILFGREGGLATVTLNRPHALNAFTLDMYRRFDPTLRDWADDPAVQAVRGPRRRRPRLLRRRRRPGDLRGRDAASPATAT